LEATAKWLERLQKAQPEMLREYLLPALAPGFSGLDLSDCLLATELKGALMPRPGDTTPVSMAVLRYVDVAQDSINLQNAGDLADELGAILGLAAERLITVPNTLALRVQGSDAVTFLAYGSAVDRRLHGPSPSNLEGKVHELLGKIAGLPDNLHPVLGAAAQLHHSAVELFENDLRSAYLLVVTGIEVLSREFGSPPGAWADWEGGSTWDETFLSSGLSEGQRDAIRSRLMKDRQLRLKATFREYASTRIPDSFWDEPWENWMYPYNASEGKWEAPHLIETRFMRDILPRDRKLLSSMLGNAYDTRSGLVHRGALLALVDSTVPFATTSDPKRPLPFAILRSILRCLVLTELETHSKSVPLPPIRLLRANVTAGAQQGNTPGRQEPV
jgi:hypothetical protein